MEGHETGGLASASYFHHHQQQQQQQQHPIPHSGNGIFSSAPGPGRYPATDAAPVFTQPVAAAAAETLPKRKRGRPRKYGPGGAAPGELNPSAKKASSASSSLLLSSSPAAAPQLHRKEQPLSSGAKKKAQLEALGNAGQGFTPHVITVAPGEDVAHKIMSFMQQGKRAVCILSATGSISNASLRQPATLGGNVTYEGRFEILSLCGSYLPTAVGGATSRTGGLSLCLSGSDGRIVGGGVGGPLKAASPVQVIVGSFTIDEKRVDSSLAKVEPPATVIGPTASPGRYRPSQDAITAIPTKMKDDHQSIGVGGFMLQRAMQGISSTDWRSPLVGPDSRCFPGIDGGNDDANDD